MSDDDCADEIFREAAALGLTAAELQHELDDLQSVPPACVPGLGAISGLAVRMLAETGSAPFRQFTSSGCYRIAAGMVHVKPGCRCCKRF